MHGAPGVATWCRSVGSGAGHVLADMQARGLGGEIDPSAPSTGLDRHRGSEPRIVADVGLIVDTPAPDSRHSDPVQEVPDFLPYQTALHCAFLLQLLDLPRQFYHNL